MQCPDGVISATHRLSSRDLQALVTGEDLADALGQLRTAELSKHKVLLAAIMRMAARIQSADGARRLPAAYRLLAEIEARHPAMVRDVLASPQFGAWAADCAAGQSSDLARLAVFAAAAGFRAGYPFEIEVPLRDGAVSFPGLGTARPGATTAFAWGRAVQDERGGRVYSGESSVRVPAPGDSADAADGWSGSPRFAASARGLRLDVELDDRDPFLDRYGAARSALSGDDARAWQDLLAQAWTVLTRDHPALAAVIAGTAATIVPLRSPSPTRSASSTATAAFGALALSMPADPLALAEALVHESHHAVLGAITDVLPMLGAGPDFLAYAPWRDDPRPSSALLHGVYTHYVMIEFWRPRCGIGSAAQRLRAQAEFGRWHPATEQAADLLARSAVLTDAGREFLAVIRANLARWRDQPLSARAVELADDLRAEHRVQWRVRHLVPDPAAIDSLAAAWRGGGPPPGSLAEVEVALRPAGLPQAMANARFYLLALRHKDPEQLRRLLAESGWIDRLDRLLVTERHAAAAAGYLGRLASDGDPGTWAGLAVASRHTGSARVARLLAERPEVAAAVCGRLRDGRLDLAPALAWLAGEP